MKVLITGRSGVGKSTTIRELASRGYTIYDTDDMPEVSRLEIKATGEPVAWPKGYVDWTHYAWRWQKGALESLLNTNGDVIIGAVMSNQRDFFHLFDLIIVLTISPDELRRRLEGRTERQYNNNQQNIDRSVERHAQKQEEMLTEDVIAVDNTGSTEAVANEIERIINERRNVA